MPQMLQNKDNLLNFVTKFGVKLYNIRTGEINFSQSNLVVEPIGQASTSNFNPYCAKIVTGGLDESSFSSEGTNYTETSSQCSSLDANETASGISFPISYILNPCNN